MATTESPAPAPVAGPRKALGRGLAALMPTGPKPAAGTRTGANSTGFRMLPVERVHANRRQPRKQFDEAALSDLAASVKAQGVLQPVVVRRQDDGYEIVAGERRWRAATRAGLPEIPAIVKDYSDAAALQVALIENVQRQDLDPLEEAEAYGRLVREHALTHDQVAEAVGKSRSAITNSLRLLKLPDAVLVMLADGRLTAGHARALMALDDDKVVARLAEDFAGRHASVRDAETKVRQLAKARGKGRAKKGKAPSAEEASVQEKLQQALGTKVRLQQRGGRGHIEIYFHSLEALEGLLDRLLPH